ncbi:hypothetical protein DRN87_03680 [Candidatus Geothermarchaeota archaeon]|nr:MAG: hypothetical protein DRN87_03680 [Candidatus Geothermarchaeota archaeon]HEW93782.1 amino acid ABC transporter substrate-binding protein [Thermoprotei archaeon]
MKTSYAIVAIIIVAIVAFALGYYVYPLTVPAPTPGVTTVTVTNTVTQTKTVTVTPTPAKTIWEEIEERGVIRVATSPDWPPFQFIDPKTNELVGYEVDLMNLVAEKLGLKVEWVTMDFDAIIAAVKNREVDLGVSGFSITPERLDEVRFSMPHIVTEVQLIMCADKAEELGITRLSSLEDIATYGIKVGTGTGTTEEQELLQLVNEGKIPGDLVKSYTDFQLALEDMKVGRIDAVYAETPITTWWISTEKVPLVVVYSRSYWPVAFVAHKDAYELIKHINAALAEIFASGEIDQIRAKWNITSGL